ncbi:hypothetical protein ANO11243_069390 [Dothideomycetidae sp. 11243]|nr:hypothetical protein ANO11243_069390 [fungal sp. No.11243]
MADSSRNRRERRADAKKTGKPFVPLTSAADIPMAVPDFSRPTSQTLYDLAEERQRDLISKGQPFSTKHGDGLARDEQGRVLLPAEKPDRKDQPATEADDDDDPAIGPLGNAIFLSVTLTILHFTLNVLVHNQYGSAPPTVSPLAWQSVAAGPYLLAAVYLLKHPAVANRPVAKQCLHFGIGTVAGCYLIWIGNKESYIDVMARAPSVGAVWIWSVVEMKLLWAVTSLGICGLWVWWHGFSMM